MSLPTLKLISTSGIWMLKNLFLASVYFSDSSTCSISGTVRDRDLKQA